MPHGYGYFTFGWLQAQREIERNGRFNQRWIRLCNQQKSLLTYASSVLAIENEDNWLDIYKLRGEVEDIEEWRSLIARNVDAANQHDLNKYATSIKKAALRTFKLMKKYSVPSPVSGSEIETIEYVPRQKQIRVNGRALLWLG